MNLISAGQCHSAAKISVPQMIKSMGFLTECGIDFDGIDLSVKNLIYQKLKQ